MYNTKTSISAQTRRTDLLQLLMDAQVGEDDQDISKLTAGSTAHEDAAKCPMTSQGSTTGKSLTDKEIVDNAFLVLLAG